MAKEKDEKKEEKPATTEAQKEAEIVKKEAKEEEKQVQKPEKKPAPTGKYKNLIKQIESLSLSDLSELVKELEERFGVSAAAPVAAPAPTAGAPSVAPGAPAAPAPKARFTVVLSAYGANKIAAIKAIREIKQDLGLKDAKDFVESAPKTVLEDVVKEEAEEAKKKLEEAGCQVELK